MDAANRGPFQANTRPFAAKGGPEGAAGQRARGQIPRGCAKESSPLLLRRNSLIAMMQHEWPAIAQTLSVPQIPAAHELNKVKAG